VRVGFLTYGLDRKPTGIGRYSLELLRSLSAHRPDCEIVVLATEPQDVFGLFESYEYHRIPGCQTLPALITYGNVAISRAARSLDLDIVHDPNGIAPFLLMPSNIRTIVTLHDAFPFVHSSEHNWLDNLRYRWYLPTAISRTDRVITVSTCSRDDLQLYLRISPEKLDVVPEGVSELFHPLSDDRVHIDLEILDRHSITSPYFLYTGALNGRKNISGLLNAFRRVLLEDPNVQLVIVGKRQWKLPPIDGLIDQLGIANSVCFTGYVADADLPALYRSARAFVFPTFYEGFGLPPLEAMACGAPVITSNRSSLPEVTGDAALLVDPFDIESIANAMKRVNAEPALREDLRRKGLQRAARFTWKNSADETASVYHASLRTVRRDQQSDITLKTR
jgi:glycosyltransferase involved in cell wall biosynthesis